MIMANYCHNSVEFSAPLPAMLQVRVMFSEWAKADKPGMPEFIQSDEGWMFDVGVGEKSVYFRTRWVPILEIVQQIAEHFGLDYVHQYEEPAMFIYGEVSRKHGEYAHVYLERRDLKGLTYDADEEVYMFRGKAYVEDFDIWVEVLNEKKVLLAEKGYLFQTESRVSKEELTELFDDLPEGNLFLKLAERKNFAAAERIFDSWDEETVIQMDNYLIAEMRHPSELSRHSRDEYIDLLFLQELIKDFDPGRARGRGR